MIVGAISLHIQPPYMLIPVYLLALTLALTALSIIRSSPNLQPAYRYIIQSQIFANLGGLTLLACSFIAAFSETHTFYLELAVDSVFHFASLCYVIVAVHRFVVIGHSSYSENRWTDSVPAAIATAALLAIGKTATLKLYNKSNDNHISEGQPYATTILLLACPLMQVCVILTLDAISFQHLRLYNAQISDRIASNKNVEWRLLSQSVCSCLPNIIFIILIIFLPNLEQYSDLIRAFATVGLQLFDVGVDSLVIIVYSKPSGYFRARTSDSLSVDSESQEESHF